MHTLILLKVYNIITERVSQEVCLPIITYRLPCLVYSLQSCLPPYCKHLNGKRSSSIMGGTKWILDVMTWRAGKYIIVLEYLPFRPKCTLQPILIDLCERFITFPAEEQRRVQIFPSFWIQRKLFNTAIHVYQWRTLIWR